MSSLTQAIFLLLAIPSALHRTIRAWLGYETDRAYTKFRNANVAPWARMIAVNGDTGKTAWRGPLGNAEIYGAVGATMAPLARTDRLPASNYGTQPCPRRQGAMP
jgi:hypothetical protein